MHHYQYNNQQLELEMLAIKDIAKQLATPFYCYSQQSIIDAYKSYSKQLTHIDAQICYAIKANSNQAIIKTLAEQGAGADVVSEGELRRALLAGISSEKIVYSGVAKTANEIRFALEQNIFQFNVESVNELHQLSKIATQLEKTAAIAFRINPDVDAITHAKITTGKSENKFGIHIKQAPEIYQLAASLPGIKVQGVDVHIGSQLTQLAPFAQTFKLINQLVKQLRQDGHDINVIDVGGGLGIDYGEEDSIAPSVVDYCKIIDDELSELNCKIILEPGRSLVANSGLLISKVIYKKQGENRVFVILDAAMNDLIRPSMYDAHHDILPVRETPNKACYDIVGPVCETGDTFAKQRAMSELEEGDLVAIVNVGAYGSVMSSTYNTRLLIPEVLVKDKQFSVIKARTSYQQLIEQDQLADWQ